MGYKCPHCGTFGKPAEVCECEGAMRERMTIRQAWIAQGREQGWREGRKQAVWGLILGLVIAFVVGVFGTLLFVTL